eukprot:988359-Prorocentrum_minimum.AAC.1
MDLRVREGWICVYERGGFACESGVASCVKHGWGHKLVSLVSSSAAVTFRSGFLSGLGGIATFPLAAPAALGVASTVRFRLCQVTLGPASASARWP